MLSTMFTILFILGYLLVWLPIQIVVAFIKGKDDE